MKKIDLSNNFYKVPEIAQTTMTRKDLQELLLDSDGKILSCGRLWDIKSRYIGSEIYRVYLERNS